jgi:DNA-binding protein HU-beta
MTMAELIAHVARSTGINQDNVKKVFEAMVLTIVEKAGEGEAVALTGLGQFKAQEVPARERRNPAIGARTKIAAARKMTFAPAKAVKDRLNT